MLSLWRIRGKTLRQIVEENINHRRGVEREGLTEQQPADHGDAERPAQFRTETGTQRQWQAGEQSGHSGHHNGAEAQQAGFVDCVGGIFSVLAFGFQREVHHHDAVLFHDADEQDDADDRDDAKILMKNNQGEECADAGGGQSGKNGDGVHEAFVKHAEHDVHRHERGKNQQRLVGQ